MAYYITLAELKSFIGTAATTDDALLTGTIIPAAHAAIDDHCHRPFMSTGTSTWTFYLGEDSYVNEYGQRQLLFYDDLADDALSITDSPNVRYLPPSGPPYYGATLLTGTWASVIEIVGHWAYSITPSNKVKLACMRLAKWMYELRETTRGDAVVITPAGAVLLPAALPADVLVLLEPLVKHRVGG